MLIRHEGFKTKAYKCPSGKVTIGVGRNLEDMGLSDDEVLTLLANDVNRCISEAECALGWYKRLDPVRQDVIVSMLFQMGLSRFLKFHKTIVALKIGDYALASKEMLLSSWAAQTPARAKELSEMMRTGSYQKAP